MLPFDQRPWAKSLAASVIVLSTLGAIWLAFYFYTDDALHISEVVGIILLLLTIVPPNLAIIMRKQNDSEALKSHNILGHTPPSVH